MNHKQLAQSVEQYAIDMRRHFHMYPEVSREEVKTSARICEELEAMGIPYDVVGNRNVVGRIECGEGKKIAIRADIDALPMQEEIECCGLYRGMLLCNTSYGGVFVLQADPYTE